MGSVSQVMHASPPGIKDGDSSWCSKSVSGTDIMCARCCYVGHVLLQGVLIDQLLPSCWLSYSSLSVGEHNDGSVLLSATMWCVLQSKLVAC